MPTFTPHLRWASRRQPLIRRARRVIAIVAAVCLPFAAGVPSPMNCPAATEAHAADMAPASGLHEQHAPTVTFLDGAGECSHMPGMSTCLSCTVAALPSVSQASPRERIDALALRFVRAIPSLIDAAPEGPPPRA